MNIKIEVPKTKNGGLEIIIESTTNNCLIIRQTNDDGKRVIVSRDRVEELVKVLFEISNKMGEKNE